MSEVNRDVDLGRLARERSQPERPTLSQPKKSWRRFALPIAILAGFAALLLWSLGDVLRPRVQVRVVRPRAATSSQQTATASLAFAAAGWVEPDPYPVHVTALTEGVVAKILVEESDNVVEGQAIAELVRDDAELDLEAKKRMLDVTRGEASEKRVALDFAEQDFAARLDLDEKLQTTVAEFAGKTAEHRDLQASVQRLEADVRAAREELSIQEELHSKGASGARQVELAAARLESTRAAMQVAAARAAHALAQVDVARTRRDRMQRDSELRIEDRRRVESAKAALVTAEHRVAEAANRVAIAELRVARLVVRAPTNGIVLERHIAPGEATDKGGIVSLYDPTKLRIRVDVPQEFIAKASVGQRARIFSEARPGKPYAGEVIRVLHRADIQKVTLEVQVRVLDPDALLRPEQLCQVRFETSTVETVGEAAGAAQTPQTSQLAQQVLLVPEACIRDGSVFVLDPDGPRARLRRVSLAGTTTNEDGRTWVTVQSGIDISDKVLIDAPTEVVDGSLVRVQGEEGGEEK